MSSAGAVRELLEERPDLAPAIEAVLEPEPPFTFDDVDLDSGRFGELVSRGVVEKGAEGYRVTDSDAVRSALSGEVPDERGIGWPAVTVPSLPVSRLELALLGGAVALAVVFRLFSLPNVYHDGYVVLSSNDPYYYRYLVEQLLSNPDVTPSNLGFTVSRGEPLFVTTLWLAALALGGTSGDASHVMAWYPVASAAVTAVLVYALAVVVSDDRRVGLASVAMLAVIPAHAVRTSLGFADHHAFDYVWLSLTLLGVAAVAGAARRGEPGLSRSTAGAVAAIAVGVAGQTLAWDNSPIVLAAVGGYLGVEGLRSVYVGDEPTRTVGPVAVGLGLGAAIVFVAHSSLGWHTVLVTSAPALLALGAVGVLVGAETVVRLGLGGRLGTTRGTAVLAVLEVVGLLAGVLVLQELRPEYWARLTTGVSSRLLGTEGIAEALGLFGEGFGWLLLLGSALFIGVPYLVWATLKVRDDGRWLPPVSFAWYFLALSAIQVRFIGELAPVISVFAGLGLVHFAERIDVARRPAPFSSDGPPALTLPTRRQFGAMVLLFLIVGSVGIIQVPVKTHQVTIPKSQSSAAIWMAEYSDEHDMSYPSNYVFSEWGRNRMYNYFVNGQSSSYGFARANFRDFVGSTEPETWYDRLDGRKGFVVTTSRDVGAPRELGTRLHRHNGANTLDDPGLARYRLVHVTGAGDYKVFRVVPGAVIQGTTDENDRVTVRTRVRVEGQTFSYVRWTTANASGGFQLRVSQPGQYRVEGSVVVVNETAVNNGMTVTAN